MPAEATSFYQDAISGMIETDDWKALAAENGLVTDYRPGDELGSYLTE